MTDEQLRWLKRERVVCGPGSNRSRAKARKAAKRLGNKLKRKGKKTRWTT